MKRSLVILCFIMLFISSCGDNGVVTKPIPFEVSMLYPPTLNNGETLSVVLKYTEEIKSVKSVNDIKIIISNRGITDSLTVIGLLKKNDDSVEEIGCYKYHGIEIIKGYGIIIQGTFLKNYTAAFDLEVVIGNQRVKSNEKLVVISKGK